MKRWVVIVLAVLLPQMLLAQGDLVTFSKNGGFYEEPFALSLQCEGNYQIRYTTNGSTPTAQSRLYEGSLLLDGQLYSQSDIYTIKTTIDELFYAPRSVQHCITLRAAAFDNEGQRVSHVVTQSYFIRSLGCDTHGLPVMALAADSLALFDHDTGILVPGANFNPEDSYWTGNYYESGREWERLVNVEFYELSDNSGINQQAGLRTHGGTARRGLQKGLKLYAREEYGAKRFKHRFFDEIPNDGFKHLVVKPFMDQWFVSGIQDDITNRMARELNMESLASRPMVLFLNGEYWGIYYLREKPDSHYLEDHFDHSDTEFNVIGNWYGIVEDGDNTNFIAMMQWLENADLTENEDYELFCSTVDVDCFIDYYCLEMFIANNDWPANNMRCYQWRDGKWRWIFFDGDDALRNSDFDVFYNATTTDNLGWPTDARSTLMFRKLLENEQFEVKFMNRLQELMTTQFSYASTKPLYEAAANRVRAEIPQQAERFNRPKHLDDWESKIANIDDFLKQQAINMRERLEEFVYVDDTRLAFSDLYPNPTHGELNLVLWSDSFTMREVVVYDVLGRQLASTMVTLLSGANTVKLPCPLASGVYLLKFGSQTKRFVIQ